MPVKKKTKAQLSKERSERMKKLNAQKKAAKGGGTSRKVKFVYNPPTTPTPKSITFVNGQNKTTPPATTTTTTITTTVNPQPKQRKKIYVKDIMMKEAAKEAKKRKSAAKMKKLWAEAKKQGLKSISGIVLSDSKPIKSSYNTVGKIKTIRGKTDSKGKNIYIFHDVSDIQNSGIKQFI